MTRGCPTGLGDAPVALGTLAVRPAGLRDRRAVGHLTALQRSLRA